MTSNDAYLFDEPDLSKSDFPTCASNATLVTNVTDYQRTGDLNRTEQQSQHDANFHKKEKWYFTLLQIVIPFLVAGFGMVGAGVLLDHVQNWDLFKKVKEVIVLVPALLGLKGNLEMTLASRLSTQVNLNQIYDKKTIRSAVLGNFALTQLQSIVIGFLASFVACITEFVLEKKFTPSNLLTLIGCSVGTASFASLLLGGIIMFIIIISGKFKINPDNIATPIASSLGDLVTLAILAYFGTFLYLNRNYFWVHILFIIAFVVCIPLLAFYCHKNEFVKETLYQGWAPVIVAMFISSLAGIILEFGIKIYNGIAIYQPVVNGVGGNIVAIYASRLSTSLHKTSEMGTWAKWAPKSCISYPFQAFFGANNPEHKTGLILLSLALPGHLIFFFTIFYIKSANTSDTIDLTGWLVLFYVMLVFTQVLILLILCYYLVHLAWRFNKNPDNVCIPLLTATGDLLGVSFLFLCFHLVYLTGNTSLRTPTTISMFNVTDAITNTTMPEFGQFSTTTLYSL